ncbi:MAG: hypothetical protein A3I66_01920 [Burkholderiales bacterium RIFCSPLOWO2_02_FULL_57_36]|nr:MAG: hypothetical protein A3I66_01920 [Burkholderiales bacterium RIFCSPLOWO2_02_FULL_57_36]
MPEKILMQENGTLSIDKPTTISSMRYPSIIFSIGYVFCAGHVGVILITAGTESISKEISAIKRKIAAREFD